MFGKGGSRVVHRDLEQAHLTLALEGVPQTDLSLFSSAGLHQYARWRHVVAAVPGVREKRGLRYRSTPSTVPYTDTGFPASTPARIPADAPERWEVIYRRHQRIRRDPDRGRDRPRQGADEGGAADGAGKLLIARRAVGASCAGLRRPQTVEELVTRIDAVSVESTRDAARGADVAQPAGRGRARQRQGAGHRPWRSAKDRPSSKDGEAAARSGNRIDESRCHPQDGKSDQISGLRPNGLAKSIAGPIPGRSPDLSLDQIDRLVRSGRTKRRRWR